MDTTTIPIPKGMNMDFWIEQTWHENFGVSIIREHLTDVLNKQLEEQLGMPLPKIQWENESLLEKHYAWDFV